MSDIAPMDRDLLAIAYRPARWDPRLRRALVLLAGLWIAGTAGIHWIEGWSVWKSFFFTLITLSTVGYTEYGLSPRGEVFAALIMIGGIAAASYCLTQIAGSIATRAMHPERKAMQQIRRLRGHHIICGAGSMGRRVIDRLESQGEVVVAIETDGDTADRLRERGLIVLRGDATADAVLHQAGIERAASVAAVTASDAVNAMICLTARALAGDLRIVARAHSVESETKLTRAGAQTVICPTIYGGDGIAEYMARPDVARVMFERDGADTATANPMRIIEVVIEEGSAQAGSTIGDFAAAHPTVTVVACRPVCGAIEMKPDADRVLATGDSVMVAGLVTDLGVFRGTRAAA